MVDRQIIYAGAIPQDVDQLSQSKNTMVGLGFLMQAILGTTAIADGLPCTPTSPATMTVNVGPGSIYSQQNVDNSAFGSLAADTANQIVKQGIVQGVTNFACPAPVTSGFSVAYLIQATYQDEDAGSTTLPYYNASNPAVAYNGPNNTGVSQNTVRKGVCVLTLKAGTPATTGTQALPANDVGSIPLWAVTVTNGQTTITSGNIIQLNGFFVATKLPGVPAAIQSGASTYAQDTSGSANAITIALTPALASYAAGQPIRVKVANTTTNSSGVMNVNGLGNVALYDTSGNPLVAGALVANGLYTFTYDGAHMVLQGTSAIPNLLTNISSAPTSNVTLTSANNRNFVGGDATGGAFTIKVPVAAGNQGWSAFIVKVDSSANAITVDGNGATISGLTQIILRNTTESVYIYCDGTNFEVISHPNRRRQIAKFTSSGTFTVPNDVKVLEKLTVTGAGGGGAGAAVNSSGGGGGSGATTISYNVAVTAGGSITVTVGTGGTAGTTAPTNGSAGSASSFGTGTPITANGGGGGNSSGSGAGGATAGATGDINVGGGGAGAGANVAGNSSGAGGASTWGSGGNGVNNGNDGIAGTAFGSGGSGGAGSASVAHAGGAGAPGVIIVEYLSAA